MTYQDEKTQEAFHLLPTAGQIALMEAENVLAAEGLELHVESLATVDEELVIKFKVLGHVK